MLEILIENLATFRIEADRLQTSFARLDRRRQQTLDCKYSRRGTQWTDSHQTSNSNNNLKRRDPEWESLEWKSLMREYHILLDGARNIEAQMRDHVELIVSLRSLIIEQLEKAIEKSKRIKLGNSYSVEYFLTVVNNANVSVTILAFVFIPIILASSVFSMNIQVGALLSPKSKTANYLNCTGIAIMGIHHGARTPLPDPRSPVVATAMVEA